MKYVFVINSFTIKKDLNKIKANIVDYCKKNNIKYVIEINNKTYSTEDILKKYKNSKNIIIAVGGDGMVNRVLQSIINTKNILGIIPYGTGNDLYKNIKVNFKDCFTTCDIVKINNKYFINVACFGIDADVANNKDNINFKYIPKSSSYIMSLIKTFFKYKNRYFEVRINNKTIKDKFSTIAVCNGSYYGNGFNIGPASILTDGNMEVYLVRNINKFKMLLLILQMHGGKHEKSRYIEKITTKNLIINSKEIVKCNIDGDVLEDKTFDIEIIQGGVNLFYDENLIKNIIK